MGRKEDVPNRRYTLEYKIEAVRLAGNVGNLMREVRGDDLS